MIVIRLTGGLGNQLFQYAFARSLSYDLDTELFLDVSIYSHHRRLKHAVFGLHSYNIKGMIGYYPYVEKTFVGIDFGGKGHKLTKYVEGLPFPDAIYYYGIVESFDIELPAYFMGWYHNQIKDGETSYITENFFKINNKLIHEDLQYSHPLSENSQKLIEDINKYDSIALHIRHGDYAKFPKFGFCTKQYYQSAISLITQNLENPKFYIFTEDPDWFEKNIEIDFPYEIIRFKEKNNSTGRGYAELLKLMSSCQHFIIANSTFSWWGAFLSENENKMIISPKPWFQDRSIIESDTIDNVKTISLKNDYSDLFENSNRVLYKWTSKSGKAFNQHFSIVLKRIFSKNPDSEVIIKFSLESNCFNGLRIYYKTEKENFYSAKKILNLYYYKNEKIDHCLILPKEVLLDELVIKPYILEKEDNEFVKLYSLEIRELIKS